MQRRNWKKKYCFIYDIQLLLKALQIHTNFHRILSRIKPNKDRPVDFILFYLNFYVIFIVLLH